MRMVINFGSLLNHFRFLQPSQRFDDLLNSPSLSLEEILDTQQDAKTELKNRNQKLLQFFTKERISMLLTYITVEPNPQQNHKVCFKYPFVASELLASQSKDLLDMFFSEPKLLEQLFSVLKKDFNSTLAGYFAKTVQALLNMNSYELLSYLYQQTGYGFYLHNHLMHKAVADLVENILMCDDFENPAFEWLLFEVLDGLLGLLNSGQGKLVVLNVTLLLTNILKKPNVSDYLLEKDRLAIITHILFSENSDIQKSAINILCAIVQNSDQANKCQQLLNLIVQNFPLIQQALLTKPQMRMSTSKSLIKPIGQFRLKILEFFNGCLKSANTEFHNSLANSKILEIFTVKFRQDLFFQHHQCSMLHIQYESLVQQILCLDTPSLINNVRNIQLVHQAKLPNRLVESALEKDRLSKGYFGFVHRIGNFIDKTLQSNLLASVPSWKQFKEGFLFPLNELQNKPFQGSITQNYFELPAFDDDSEEQETEEEVPREEPSQKKEVPRGEPSQKEEDMDDSQFYSTVFWKVDIGYSLEELS